MLVLGGQMAQHLPLAGLAGIGSGHVRAGHCTALQSTSTGSMNTQQKYSNNIRKSCYTFHIQCEMNQHELLYEKMQYFPRCRYSKGEGG